MRCITYHSKSFCKLWDGSQEDHAHYNITLRYTDSAHITANELGAWSGYYLLKLRRKCSPRQRVEGRRVVPLRMCNTVWSSGSEVDKV